MMNKITLILFLALPAVCLTLWCSSHKCFHNHHCCSFNCTTRGCVCVPDGGECRVDAACCSKQCTKESKKDKFGFCEQPGKKSTKSDGGDPTPSSTTPEVTPSTEEPDTTTPTESPTTPTSSSTSSPTTPTSVTPTTNDGAETSPTDTVSTATDEGATEEPTSTTEQQTTIEDDKEPEDGFRIKMWMRRL